MARIRSIHPGFCTSLDVADLSRDAQLHFVRLWTHCDDSGRLVDDPRLIKAACWPLDDDITAGRVEDLQAELERTNHLVRYRHDGRSYAQVVNWAAYQKPQKPIASKLPPPPVPQALSPAETPPTVQVLYDDGTPTVPVEKTYGSGEGVGVGVGVGEGDIALRPKPERKTKTLTKSRPADPVWDALVECFGPPSNDADRKRRNTATKLLRQTLDTHGLPPPEHSHAVAQLCAAYTDAMPPGSRRTPMAVASNADLLVAHIQGRNQPSPTQHEVAGYGVVG